MIALIAQKNAGSWFNWFDITLVLTLAFGFWRGRKYGLSREFLPTTQWLVTLGTGSFGYAPLGNWLLKQGVIQSVLGHHFSEPTAAYITAYLTILLAVFTLFSFIKRLVKTKLEGSDFFGSGEYYLGMIAGVIHYAAILLVLLALLNAPFYSVAEINAQKTYNNKVYGGGVAGYSGDFIPSLQEVQASVFKGSLIGPFLKDNLSVLLIDIPAESGARKPSHH